MNRRLKEYLNADAVWSEAHVLRPPGTFNHKPRAAGSGASWLVRPHELLDGAGRSRPWSTAELGETLPPDKHSSRRRISQKVPRRRNRRSYEEILDSLPVKVRQLASGHSSTDRSGQSWHLVNLLMKQGLYDDECSQVLDRHPPTQEKADEHPDPESYIDLTIDKARALHDHPGTTCTASGCVTSYQPPEHIRDALFKVEQRMEKGAWRYGGGQSDKAVLGAHLEIARQAGALEYDASVRELGDRAGVSKNTVVKSQRELIHDGWIARVACGDRVTDAHRYQLLVKVGTHKSQAGTTLLTSTSRNVKCVPLLGDSPLHPARDFARHGGGINKSGRHILCYLSAQPLFLHELVEAVDLTESYVRRLLCNLRTPWAGGAG